MENFKAEANYVHFNTFHTFIFIFTAPPPSLYVLLLNHYYYSPATAFHFYNPTNSECKEFMCIDYF